jgi:predicted transcriptional regulator
VRRRADPMMRVLDHAAAVIRAEADMLIKDEGVPAIGVVAALLRQSVAVAQAHGVSADIWLGLMEATVRASGAGVAVVHVVGEPIAEAEASAVGQGEDEDE